MGSLKLDHSSCPAAWQEALQNAGDLYITLLGGKVPSRKVTFLPGEKNLLCVREEKGAFLVEAGTLALAMRGFAFALAGEKVEEKDGIPSYGFMLDASRNRVWHVPFLKKVLLYAAFLGYDHFMLYLEDTYKLDGEIAFGFMRGAYTKEELKEILSFAASLGLKMIPCIQTFGHMENLLKLSQYAALKDTQNILLAGDEATYTLLEKMIRFWAELLPGSEIHLGMDEAVQTGRGKYLDKFGFRDRKEILLEHLQRVASLCRKYSLTPMIWADMLLHGESSLEDMKKALPEDLQLYHWDYSGDTPEKYSKAFARLAPLEKEITMTGSVYSYNVFTWVAPILDRVAPPCVAACRENHIKRFLVSVWGDAGSFACSVSWMAGLADYASFLRGHTPEKVHGFSEKFVGMLLKEDYSFLRKASDLEMLIGPRLLPAPGLFWEDPIQASVYGYCYTAFPEKMQTYKELLEKLALAGDLLPRKTSGSRLLTVLAKGMRELLLMREELLASYPERDREGLERLRKDIPRCKKYIRAFDRLFREEWLSTGKEFGLEIIQRRNAGLLLRLGELAMQLKELQQGKRTSLPEIEEALKVFQHPENIVVPPVFSGSLETY